MASETFSKNGMSQTNGATSTSEENPKQDTLATRPGHPVYDKDHTPYVQRNLVRQKIERENNFQQAGERYRAFTNEECDKVGIQCSRRATGNPLRTVKSK